MKRIIVVAVLLLMAGSACGKKGDPRAPELAAPRPIDNLRGRQDRNNVVLTWSRPSEYVGGGEVKDLASFVIFRKEIPPNCPDCLVPYRPLITVNVEDQEKFIKQKQYRFIDEQVQPKATYRYRVSSQLRDGSLSEPSNEIEIVRGP
jgi:hypothetical protein